MNKLLISATFIGLVGLTACSESGSDLGASAGENLADYEDLAALSEQIDEGQLAASDTTSRAGTATFTGAIGLGELGDDGDLELVGDLSIDANFDANTATGSATGFTIFNGDTDGVEGDVGGTLTLDNGTINGTDFDATLAGTLTESGDNFDFDLLLDGGFYDNNGDLIVGGDVIGTMDDGGTIESVEGGFVAVE
jgi:hypothetical protein